ncbi:MAG: ABC transporter substrate-binding protein [Porticoccaceae bacterium]
MILTDKIKSRFSSMLGKALFFPHAIMLFVFLFASNNSYSNKFEHALFILSKDRPDYRQVVNLITADWAKSKKYGYTVLIQDQKTEVDQRLKSTDIIVTLGTDAANSVLSKKLSQPIINTLITQSAFDSLAVKYFGDVNKAIASGINPIILDQPFERRLNLASRLLKNIADVGIMMGPSAANKFSLYTDSINQRNLKPQMLLIDPDENPIRQLDPVVKASDVFIPIADSHLINVTTAKWILQLAYRHRVPVIGYSSNYVAAGALASVYSSPEDVAKQSIELIDAVLTKDHIHQVHVPKYCTIKFNETVAWHLNLIIPVELEKNTGPCDL